MTNKVPYSKIIFQCVAGSQLYGMATPESDEDVRGVAFEHPNAIIGLSPFDQFVQNIPDVTIFGLRKFVQLALENNPNIIELLFVPESMSQIYTEEWHRLQSYRYSFLSKKIAKTFVGYALGQAKRMKTHHDWMTGNSPERPDPFDYGAYYGENGSINWIDSNRKQQYDNLLTKYQQYKTWLENRNEKRHILEEKYGYDTKHGSHIVRLLDQGRELLLTGNLIFPRPNADLLKQIRNGIWSYDYLIGYMEGAIEAIDIGVLPESKLPEKPRQDNVEFLLMQLYADYLTKQGWTTSSEMEEDENEE